MRTLSKFGEKDKQIGALVDRRKTIPELVATREEEWREGGIERETERERERERKRERERERKRARKKINYRPLNTQKAHNELSYQPIDFFSNIRKISTVHQRVCIRVLCVM